MTREEFYERLRELYDKRIEAHRAEYEAAGECGRRSMKAPEAFAIDCELRMLEVMQEFDERQAKIEANSSRPFCAGRLTRDGGMVPRVAHNHEMRVRFPLPLLTWRGSLVGRAPLS